LLGTVKLSLTNFALFQVRLEDGIRMLGLHLIEISGKLLVILAEFLLGNNLIDFIIFAFIWVSLTAKHERHLLLNKIVGASLHNLLDKFNIVHFLSNSHGIAVLALSLVDVEGSSVR